MCIRDRSTFKGEFKTALTTAESVYFKLKFSVTAAGILEYLLMSMILSKSFLQEWIIDNAKIKKIVRIKTKELVQ